MSMNTNTNTAGINLNEVKADPVKWAVKGNKISYGNVTDLKPDPLLNIRHRVGTVVHGVTVTKDTYDIPQMKLDIVEMVGIQEPILVSVRKTGEMVPLRGNRRTYAGQELLSDITISAELREALTKKTPMILLHGLTGTQERELIQDQSQKSFMHSEAVKHIFALRGEKKTFEEIAVRNWELLGKLRGNAKKVAEIRDIQDPNVKREKIKTWLRGTLDCYLIWGYDLGEFVRKCIIQSEMRLDGLIGENDEKPYFITTKKSQERIAALKKAREADGTKWNGTILVEGSEFKKVIDKFHAEDFGTTVTTSNASGPKMMKRADLEGIKDTFSSRAVRAMIARVLGNDVPDLVERDEFAAQMETKQMLVDQYMARLKPDVAAVLRLVFNNPDANDFQEFLAVNCTAVEVKEDGSGENVVPGEAQADENGEYKLGGEESAAE